MFVPFATRRLGALMVALLTTVSCPPSARADGCVPGAQMKCACPGGESGIQVCSDDGTHLEKCECATAANGTDEDAAPSESLKKKHRKKRKKAAAVEDTGSDDSAPTANLEGTTYTGGPIPPGMTVKREKNILLFGFGTLLFGGGYIAASTIAYVSKETEPCANFAPYGYIPLIGPLLGMGKYDCSKYQGEAKFYSVMISVTQITGLSMAIAGAMSGRRYLTHSTKGATVAVVPGASGADIAGASLAVTF